MFFRRELIESVLSGKLHIDAETIGPLPGFVDQLMGCLRNRLQVDVALKPIFGPQRLRGADQVLHRIVAVLDYAGAEKEAFYIVSPVEVHRDPDDFFYIKAGPADAARAAVYAIRTVVDAVVSEKDLEQGDAATIRGVAMADSHSVRRAKSDFPAFAAPRSAAGTRGIVFCGVGEDCELGVQIHRPKILRKQ